MSPLYYLLLIFSFLERKDIKIYLPQLENVLQTEIDILIIDDLADEILLEK